MTLSRRNLLLMGATALATTLAVSGGVAHAYVATPSASSYTGPVYDGYGIHDLTEAVLSLSNGEKHPLAIRHIYLEQGYEKSKLTLWPDDNTPIAAAEAEAIFDYLKAMGTLRYTLAPGLLRYAQGSNWVQLA